jgi:hypothetical protein
MNPYVIIPVAAAVLLLVFLLNIPRLNRLHEIAGTRFICPRCGYRFRVKWYKLLFTRWWVEVKDQAPLTCPLCRSHDLCRREEE